MALRTKSFGLVAFAALTTLALAAQAGPLVRKVKVGDESKYRVKGNVDLGGADVTFSSLQSERVTEVAPDGTYTVETKSTESKASFAGQDIDIPADRNPTTTVVYNADGTVKEIRGDVATPEAYRFANLSSVPFTSKDVAAIGTAWTNEKASDAQTGTVAFKASYKIVGEEKVGNWDTWKIEYSVKETDGDSPATVDGNVWLDKNDGSLVKNEGKVGNVRFPAAPLPASGTISVIRE